MVGWVKWIQIHRVYQERGGGGEGKNSSDGTALVVVTNCNISLADEDKTDNEIVFLRPLGKDKRRDVATTYDRPRVRASTHQPVLHNTNQYYSFSCFQIHRSVHVVAFSRQPLSATELGSE